VGATPPDQPSREALERLAEGFASLAAEIERGHPEHVLLEEMQRTQRLASDAATRQRGERQQLLLNVAGALTTWQEVWPRLGTQREFRLAVAREARLWAKRFAG
jgi:hypothetical protein